MVRAHRAIWEIPTSLSANAINWAGIIDRLGRRQTAHKRLCCGQGKGITRRCWLWLSSCILFEQTYRRSDSNQKSYMFGCMSK